MRELKAFKVLSDETRLRILNLLLDDECCVCEIMQALGMSQSKASRGLIALYEAGFLKMRRDGLWSLYSLDEQAVKGYKAGLIEAVKEFFKNSEIAVSDKKRMKAEARIGPGCINK